MPRPKKPDQIDRTKENLKQVLEESEGGKAAAVIRYKDGYILEIALYAPGEYPEDDKD